ncbi:hypothetical protein [Methyloraptor flagellatus]|uniref:Lipoprotein n=1 Tax=Methyloraptor flagellatus TaxID=3162530 RepID=A0AAU7XFI1_9HYPH
MAAALAACLGGCSDWTEAVVTSAAASASASTPVADLTPTASTGFPLAGRWAWSTGGRRLPSRDIGCSAGRSHLVIDDTAVRVERDAWSQDVFTIGGWRRIDRDKIELKLDETAQAGRRRLRAVVAVANDRARLVSAEVMVDTSTGLTGDALLKRRLDDGRAVAELEGIFKLENCERATTLALASMRSTIDMGKWELRR